MECVLRSTYGQFLEGYPDARVNDAIVTGVTVRAQRVFPHQPVWVIPPPRTAPDNGGQGEVLPPVVCSGMFLSTPVDPGLDDILFLSGLVIVWFQEDTELPEGWEAPVELLDVHWDELAQDGEV